MVSTYLELRELFLQLLKNSYDEREIRFLFQLYVEYKFGLKKETLYLNLNSKVDEELSASVMEDLQRLTEGVPIQYVTGNTLFYGLPFIVTPSVLIPRPETEELTDLIIRENEEKEGLRVMDIGTGSGAIAITLAGNLKHATVFGLDVSQAAIKVARENAHLNGVEVTFSEFDLLNPPLVYPIFTDMDIIVSNPPYIPESEKELLHVNVKEYEPGSALFVPDHDPLVFYRKIAELASSVLKSGGKIYLETHELFHEELEILFDSFGYYEIRKMKDLNGKPRMFFCRKK